MTEHGDYSLPITAVLRQIEAVTLGSEYPEAPGYMESHSNEHVVKAVIDVKEISFPLGISAHHAIPAYCAEKVSQFCSGLEKHGFAVNMEHQKHFTSDRPKLTVVLPNTVDALHQLHAVHREMLLHKAVEIYKDTNEDHAIDFIRTHISKHAVPSVLQDFGKYLAAQKGSEFMGAVR